MTEKKLHECKLCGAIDNDIEINLGEHVNESFRIMVVCKRCGNIRLKVE